MAYIKIEGVRGSASGVGIFRINFYDMNNSLISLNQSNVLGNNANSNNTNTALSAMLTNTTNGGTAAPYLNSSSDNLTFVIQLPDDVIGLNEISILNWTDATYACSSINVSYSKDNINYILLESKAIAVGERISFAKYAYLTQDRIVLKNKNKLYSIYNQPSTIERGIIEFSINNKTSALKYGQYEFLNLNNKFENKYYILQSDTTVSTEVVTSISKIPLTIKSNNRIILKKVDTGQYYSIFKKTLLLLPNNSETLVNQYGLVPNDETKLDEDFDKIITVNADGTYNQVNTNAFSVYDYLNDNLEFIGYSKLNSDILIETTTTPYSLTEEISSDAELIYYTDDEPLNSNLIIEANYSPLDELTGDLEVVYWTDNTTTNSKVLTVNGEHSPVFTYLEKPVDVTGVIGGFIVSESATSDNTRYLLSDDKNTWYRWDGTSFNPVDITNVSTQGMTLSELMTVDYSKWTYPMINIGMYITNDSLITNIDFNELVSDKTSEVSDLHFYILNTTAKIDIQLVGNTITGQLTDDDFSKVQYRVILNGGFYYPPTGAYTALSSSPTNIDLTLTSRDVLIGQWNDLVVEFKDSFGTVDSWQVQFMGRYNGLVFRSLDGKYYSSDIGAVLNYLDFGTVIAGQTTTEYEVLLTNQNGFKVKDIQLSVAEVNLPSGVKVEFANKGVQNWQNRLPVAGNLSVDEEVPFLVRMVTQLDATPRNNGTFDIYVNAIKDV